MHRYTDTLLYDLHVKLFKILKGVSLTKCFNMKKHFKHEIRKCSRYKFMKCLINHSILVSIKLFDEQRVKT